MLRVLLTIVLPLILPTALYLLWLRTTQWSASGGTMRWRGMPWAVLAGAGAVLLALVLFVVTVHFGTAERGIYVPPQWHDGQIVPGHIEKTGR
ncbi:MAG: hypothetical protein JO305_02415 [Alphaproteobacteria bacterium]|nr:hypothetical protein [Alphaproteobacteria bacterium]